MHKEASGIWNGNEYQMLECNQLHSIVFACYKLTSQIDSVRVNKIVQFTDEGFDWIFLFFRISQVRLKW